MSKFALSCILLLAWMFIPSPSSGEELLPGRWWHVPEVSELLQLTDVQKKQLDDLYNENRNKLLELKNTVEAQQAELGKLVDKEPLNESAISTQMKSLEFTRAKLSAERLRYVVEVRKLLGPERFLHLKQFYRDSREQRDRST